VEEYRSEMAGRSMPASEVLSEIASLYIKSGNIKKAEKYAREAYSLNPDDPVILNKLAYLLIDKELNVSEGLNLATEGLKIRPYDHYLLHTLGWGLAKSGSYRESLEALSKSWESRPEYDNSLLQHIAEVRKQISTLN
jgi:tetratricopeptide (TPR) repeat protein